MTAWDLFGLIVALIVVVVFSGTGLWLIYNCGEQPDYDERKPLRPDRPEPRAMTAPIERD